MSLFAPSMILYYSLAHCLKSQRHDNSLLIIISLKSAPTLFLSLYFITLNIIIICQKYWYELFLDDLPMWGMVGEVLRDDAHSRMEKHIFTHRSLSIAYSGDKVIEVNLTSENPVPIEVGKKLEFTYSFN